MQDHSIEVWKDVKGYEGYYQVSDIGQVRSLDRVVVHKNGKRQPVAGRMIKAQWNGKYYHVPLGKNGKESTVLIHRLVTEAFVGPCPEKMECRHLDGNPRNNLADNLRWGTHRANVDDKRKHGTLRGAHKGEKHHLAKLTAKKVLLIRKLMSTGKYKGREIANKFGVSDGSVRDIVKRRTWNHI